MSIPPLFTKTSSVYHRDPNTWQDDEVDADVVDACLPSTPILEIPDSKSSPSISPPPADQKDVASGYNISSEDVKEEVNEAGTTPSRDLDDSPEGNSEGDERQCRICFGGMEEEAVLGRLISPCLCSGSMRVGLIFLT